MQHVWLAGGSVHEGNLDAFDAVLRRYDAYPVQDDPPQSHRGQTVPLSFHLRLVQGSRSHFEGVVSGNPDSHIAQRKLD